MTYFITELVKSGNLVLPLFKAGSCLSIIYNFKVQELNLTRMIGLEKGIPGNEELTQVTIVMVAC